MRINSYLNENIEKYEVLDTNVHSAVNGERYFENRTFKKFSIPNNVSCEMIEKDAKSTIEECIFFTFRDNIIVSLY